MAYPRRTSRQQRARVAARLAHDHGGVVHRRDLLRLGVTRSDVRAERLAGRWELLGRHTVRVAQLEPHAQWWLAVWESGSAAHLDGAAALVASGLNGFQPARIDISLPRNNRRHRRSGVVLHQRLTMPPTLGAGVPRVRPDVALVHAAAWAVSERQAALLICLAVQQRLVPPQRLLRAWSAHQLATRGTRRTFLATVVRDVGDGAHSLGELDFALLCRRRGLPSPARQVVVELEDGRVYLDVRWHGRELVVEVDGGHHALALNTVADALRQNEVVLTGSRVLRLPVLGLRLEADAFMDQVARGLAQSAAA